MVSPRLLGTRSRRAGLRALPGAAARRHRRRHQPARGGRRAGAGQRGAGAAGRAHARHHQHAELPHHPDRAAGAVQARRLRPDRQPRDRPERDHRASRQPLFQPGRRASSAARAAPDQHHLRLARRRHRRPPATGAAAGGDGHAASRMWCSRATRSSAPRCSGKQVDVIGLNLGAGHGRRRTSFRMLSQGGPRAAASARTCRRCASSAIPVEMASERGARRARRHAARDPGPAARGDGGHRARPGIRSARWKPASPSPPSSRARPGSRGSGATRRSTASFGSARPGRSAEGGEPAR